MKVAPLAPEAVWKPGRRLLAGQASHVVERSRFGGRFVYLQLEGVCDRTAAEALRGQLLQVPETDLPPLGEGEFYRFQLVGLAVRTRDGRELGRLEEILTTPGHDVYLIRGPLGEVLVPAVEDFVLEVDLDAGVVTVEAVPGLLPDS